ncbi:MAG: hypothetical protein V7607_2354 [Solirubrobacteraceae bacterium]
MTTILCSHGGYCIRAIGHTGCHTACPSAATLDWDHDRAPTAQHHIDAAVTLLTLDFPTPPWGDLNDSEPG